MNKLMITLLVVASFNATAETTKPVVAGYFADWQYENEQNPYTVKDIPRELDSCYLRLFEYVWPPFWSQ